MRPLVSLFACLVLVFGCDHVGASQENPRGNAIYETSFERAADTSGWSGYGTLALRSNAPPDEEGSQSAYVSGGCIIPHAAYELTAPASGPLVLRVSAKNLAIGGSVALENAATGKSVHVRVQGDGWKQIKSKTLSVQAGQTLHLTMHAGGIAASAMLVDRIEILPAAQVK